MTVTPPFKEELDTWVFPLKCENCYKQGISGIYPSCIHEQDGEAPMSDTHMGLK